MTTLPTQEVPQHILKDSVLAHIAAAYFSAGKQLEKKTNCSATRGFILSTLRDAATLNQNQIATLLNLDRTVVHRSIKTMVRERLIAERKAKSGRAILLNITPKGSASSERAMTCSSQRPTTTGFPYRSGRRASSR